MMFGSKAPEPPPHPTKVRVLKFPIPLDDEWHEIPYHRSYDGERGWHIGMQNGVVMLWTIPTTEVVETDDRVDLLKVVGTGHRWDSRNYYVGSVQDGPFVWHVIAGGF